MADNSAEPTSAFDGVTVPAFPPTVIHDTDVLLLPRFFLMVALKENLTNLQENADREHLEGFWDTLIEILEEIRKAVSKIEGGSKLEDGILRAKDVVDTKLVPYLQSQPNVPRMLDSYLPPKAQTWEDFLQGKPEHERKLVMSELDIQDFQDHLPDIVLLYMDQFVKDVMEFRRFIAGAELPAMDISYTTPFSSWAEAMGAKKFYKVVQVYYATDRKLEHGEYKYDDQTPLFPWQFPGQTATGKSNPASVPDDFELPPLRPLEYGIVGVSIPSIHKPGVVETPGWLEKKNPYKHVLILPKYDKKLRGDEGKFFTILNKDLIDNKESDLLIFIHGFNTSHDGALKHAAQLKFDLDFKGAMVAYSWSSAGNLRGYLDDQVAIEHTVQSLKGFLLAIMAKMEVPTRIHLLAHSMGNRAMIKALDLLLSDGPDQIPNLPNPRCPIATVISAAGDDSPVNWQNLIAKMRKVYPRNAEGKSSRPLLSVYSSNEDCTLKLSRAFHHWEVRLGETNRLFERPPDAPPLTLDYHDVIDATGVDPMFPGGGHGYFGDAVQVLADLHDLITKSVPAIGRLKLFHVKKSGFNFFAFNKGKWFPYVDLEEIKNSQLVSK